MDLSAKIERTLQEALETERSHGNAPSAALKAALDENQDLIRKGIAHGYTATGLAKKLKAAGISASVETLQQYVKHVTKTKATATERNPKRLDESSESRRVRPAITRPTRQRTDRIK
jgi:hypothetical protein